MAFCSICGDSCGLATACETRVSLGVPPEKVRAEVKLAQRVVSSMGLYSSSSSVSVLAMVLFPILIIAGAFEAYPLLGSDASAGLVCGGIGALLGGLVAGLMYHWFRMQALLARRITEYLDSH